MRVLQRPAVLDGLRPGRYELHARVVTLTHSTAGAPAGSTVLPTFGLVRVTVRPGVRVRAVVRYGTIVSSRDHVLRRAPTKIVGPATDPSALLLAAPTATGLRTGSILAQAPSSALPAGLFDQVTAESHTAAGDLVSIRPAALTTAFPELDITATVPLTTAPQTTRSASAAALSDVDLAFSHDLLDGLLEASCGAPPTGWSLSPSGTIGPVITLHLHRRYQVVPYGDFSLTLTGNLSVTVTIPTGTHCDLTLPGPAFEGVIYVGEVPIPVTGSVNLVASVTSDDPVIANARAHLSVTAGMHFDGDRTSPILSLKAAGGGDVNAGGATISLGPAFQVGLGVSGFNGHIADTPQLVAKVTRTGCEIDIADSGGVGLDVTSFHPSYNPFHPSTPISHCTPPKPGPAGPAGAGAAPTGPTLPTSTGPATGPITMPGPAGTIGVSLGIQNSCAVSALGTIDCWGNGNYGALGNGSTDVNSSTPVSVTGITGASAISSGTDGSCALLSGGHVACWGHHVSGSTDALIPEGVAGVTDAIAVSTAGNGYACALLSGGSVDCWSNASTAAIVAGVSNATSISIGPDGHVCALLATGTVTCWGPNTEGQLGDGTTTSRTSPSAVIGLAGAMAVSSGQEYTCALLVAGEADCWGANAYGQLGNGTTTPSPSPTPVSGLTGAATISSGFYHSCAVVGTGAVRCWGLSRSEDPFTVSGTGSLAPLDVPGVAGATAVAAGYGHTCAIVTGGQVDCWGYNTYGELGNGTNNAVLGPVIGLP